MIFRPFHYFDTGCAAYVFGCGTAGRCAVVDPQERDVDAYSSFAAAKGMTITHVFDTHVHADHRSGGRELARRTGAKYCLHRSADVAFPFEPVDDGQRIELGNTLIDVLHTPGHTPESIALVVQRPAPRPGTLVRVHRRHAVRRGRGPARSPRPDREERRRASREPPPEAAFAARRRWRSSRATSPALPAAPASAANPARRWRSRSDGTPCSRPTAKPSSASCRASRWSSPRAWSDILSFNQGRG